LRLLGCNNNNLTSLDLTSCEKLEDLVCKGNQLSQLDLRQNKKLIELRCQQNQLTKLVFPPQLSNLETLICHDNFLTNLNWSVLNKGKLIALGLQNNDFTSQDLS